MHLSQTIHLLPLTLHRPAFEGVHNRNIKISGIVDVWGAFYLRLYLLPHTHGQGLCNIEHCLLPMGVLGVWGGGEYDRLVYL